MFRLAQAKNGRTFQHIPAGGGGGGGGGAGGAGHAHTHTQKG
jgi:hypothetical protein